MGMYGSQPKSPDPRETASAQTGTNVGTAIANSVLGQVNQVTPDGSLTYSQTGTYKWTDPMSGKVYDLPQTTATQTLSEMQQNIKNAEDAANLNMANLGRDQSNRLNTILSEQFNPQNLPAATDWSKIGLPQYTNYAGGPDLKNNIDAFGNIQTSAGTPGAVGDTIANAGDITRGIADAGGIASEFGEAGDIRRGYQNDFSADRQRVEDALMERLNPQLARDREALGTRLAAQGLQPGSEAYNRAIEEASRQSAEARTSAILGAGQEQSRLAELARQEAEFGNAAQRQAYEQAYGRGSFANAAQAQRYGQNAQNAAFGNQAQQQQFAQNAAELAAANEAQKQRWAQAVEGAEFGNRAQAQGFGQNQAQAQFGNQSAQAEYDNYMRQVAGNNQLQDSAYNAAITRGTNVDNSRARALQEAFAMRQQPINEIAALLQGGQATMPQFMNLQGVQMPTVDYAGLVQQDYANRMQQYQNNQSNIGGLMGGLASFFL